jgi:hypothetical protein
VRRKDEVGRIGGESPAFLRKRPDFPPALALIINDLTNQKCALFHEFGLSACQQTTENTTDIRMILHRKRRKRKRTPRG